MRLTRFLDRINLDMKECIRTYTADHLKSEHVLMFILTCMQYGSNGLNVKIELIFKTIYQFYQHIHTNNLATHFYKIDGKRRFTKNVASFNSLKSVAG